MLLLDKDKLSSGDQGNATGIRKICIISDRDEVSGEIAQLLRTRGLEHIEILQTHFLNEKEDFKLSPEAYVGVIIDIQDAVNIQDVLIRTRSVIPQNVWCCLVGDNDSIRFAQRFAKEGLIYFHTDTQLYQMVDRIISGVNIPTKRHTVKISVLGCKGGIGTSLIAIHLSNMIVNESKVPVLLIQGNGGSQDLDIFFDKKVQKKEITEYNDFLHLYRGELENVSEELVSSYNYIIYDQPIFNVDREQYDKFLNTSDNFVIVTDRNVSSLRVARAFITELDRIRTAEERLIRSFVCISDHRMELSRAMSTSDVERLLKTDVDSIIPFLSKTNIKKALSINFGRQGSKQLTKLTQSVIGVLSRKYHSRKPKGLRGFLIKLLMGK